MGHIEKRKAVRVIVEVAAEIYTANEIIPASTRNLSSEGVCLEGTKVLEEGSTVGVSLFLTADGIEDPDVEPVNIKADVIWCTETDEGNVLAGARFKDMAPQQTAIITSFLSAISQ